MKRYFYLRSLVSLFLMTGIILTSGCEKMKNNTIKIIPIPLTIESRNGEFKITNSTQIVVANSSEKLRPVAEYLAAQIKTASGFDLMVSINQSETDIKDQIIFSSEGNDPDLGEEGYILNCTKSAIEIIGAPAGAFYAVQTLFQLLPAEIFSSNKPQEKIDWIVPAARIEDKPRFVWRGMHLDVCRHMFPVEFIKRYIDYLAMHKFNKFHWHLTDDQGWRIEIKKYPRLTEIGAWRDATLVGHLGKKPHTFDNIRYGGFYTQDEIREIVQYARERFITVVPEIEMPGHSIAALTAYPHLSCTGGPFKVRQIWGIEDNIYCAGNEEVFTFLEDVLTEVLSLFPSEYIHIGGDEAPKIFWKECSKCQKRIKDENLKDEHELQSYFIGRIEKFLNSKGRQIIGWDEILEGGLAPNAAVMSWRGIEGGIEAAKLKHNVVMTPSNYCYFNDYQSDPSLEPLAIGGYLPLEKVYEYEPIPVELSPQEVKYILGAQGNVWTEYIKTPEDVEYMAIPRMSALAEVVWSKKENKDFNDFLKRMSFHYNRLDAKGVNYHWPSLTGFSKNNVFIDKKKIEIKNQRKGSSIYYTLDGSEPSEASTLYDKPIIFTETTTLKVREYMPNGRAGRTFEGNFVKSVPLKASKTQGLEQGVQYNFFEFDEPIHSINDLVGLKPNDSGTLQSIIFPEIELPEYFGLIISGYIEVPKTGVYTFYAESNDGSGLYIGENLVVDNDGSHGAVERSGQVALEAGVHPIKVSYFQEGGAKALKVSIKGPDLDKREIPVGMFY